jgi:predicted nucleic acid-binding protein
LDQKRAGECEAFLEHVREGSVQAVITDFTIDTIIVIMENEGKRPTDISLFLSSLLGYGSLDIYFLSLYDRIEATRHMQKFKVDFEDSTVYQAMRSLNVKQVVSFDRHFDKISDIARIEPQQANHTSQ